MRLIRSFLVSFPERLVRSGVAVVANAVDETAEVVLPRIRPPAPVTLLPGSYRRRVPYSA
jgi:hypothetical protein